MHIGIGDGSLATGSEPTQQVDADGGLFAAAMIGQHLEARDLRLVVPRDGVADDPAERGAEDDVLLSTVAAQQECPGRLHDRLLLGLEHLPQPVIACVNGFALGGGCEIAMACDFIFEPDMQRTIVTDIRYVLFIIDKFAGAHRLIEEMTIL